MSLPRFSLTHPHSIAAILALVCLLGLDGRIEAFIVYWLAVEELQILNIATEPALRRRGHAARLLEHAIAAARRAEAKHLLLEVRRSNEPAKKLYAKYGFRPIGVRANYYAAEHEDAIARRRFAGSIDDDRA